MVSTSPSLAGIPVEFFLFAFVLAGVALFPLLAGWRNVRRKGLALAATLASLALLSLLIAIESFTGHLLGGFFRTPDGIPRGTVLRFTALHAVGFPLLSVLAFGVLLWVQNRIAKRAEADPTSPDPSSDPPRT